MVVHRLVEEGALALEDRIADYIPEYAQHGKGETTIGHVLCPPRRSPDAARTPVRSRSDRRSGVAQRRDRRSQAVRQTGHASGLPRRLRRFRARRGRLPGYRADGTRRAARAHPGAAGVPLVQLRRQPAARSRPWASATRPGARLLPPLSTLSPARARRADPDVVELSNDPRFLTAIVPSANIVTTAHELSRFFEIFRCGGELDGVRVMAPQTLRTRARPSSHGSSSTSRSCSRPASATG